MSYKNRKQRLSLRFSSRRELDGVRAAFAVQSGAGEPAARPDDAVCSGGTEGQP